MFFAKRKQRKEARLAEEKAYVLENEDRYYLFRTDEREMEFVPFLTQYSANLISYFRAEDVLTDCAVMLSRELGKGKRIITEMRPYIAYDRGGKMLLEYFEEFDRKRPPAEFEIPSRYGNKEVLTFLTPALPLELLEFYASREPTDGMVLSITMFTQPYEELAANENVTLLLEDAHATYASISIAERPRVSILLPPEDDAAERVTQLIRDFANKRQLRLEVE